MSVSNVELDGSAMGAAGGSFLDDAVRGLETRQTNYGTVSVNSCECVAAFGPVAVTLTTYASEPAVMA